MSEICYRTAKSIRLPTESTTWGALMVGKTKWWNSLSLVRWTWCTRKNRQQPWLKWPADKTRQRREFAYLVAAHKRQSNASWKAMTERIAAPLVAARASHSVARNHQREKKRSRPHSTPVRPQRTDHKIGRHQQTQPRHGAHQSSVEKMLFPLLGWYFGR